MIHFHVAFLVILVIAID